MLSLPHLVVVFVIALVVFGPQKLPELARTLGKLMAEFRKASGDFRSAFEDEMRDLERQARETERKVKEAARMHESTTPKPPETVPPATLADPNVAHGENTSQSSGGEQSASSTESIPIDESVLDATSPSDLGPADEPHYGPSYHQDHQDSQPEQDDSNAVAKPNHVNRRPA